MLSTINPNGSLFGHFLPFPSRSPPTPLLTDKKHLISLLLYYHNKIITSLGKYALVLETRKNPWILDP